MPIRKCSFCDSSFSKVEHLKRHERSHTGEKPYECRKCRKRFSRGDVLTRHLKGHDENNVNVRTSALSSANTPSPQGERASPKRKRGTISSPSARRLSQPYRPSPNPERDDTAPAPLDANTVHVFTGDSLEIETLLHQAGIPISPNQFTPAYHSHGAQNHTSLSPSSEQGAEGIHHLLQASHSPAGPQPEAIFDEQEDSYPFDGFVSNWDIDPLLTGSDSHDGAFVNPLQSNWMTAPDTGLEMSDNNSGDWLDPLLMPMPIQPVSTRQRRASSFGSDISDHRFAKMARVWPKKTDRPWRLIHTVWHDVINHDARNLFSDVAVENPSNSHRTQSHTDRSTIDDERRLELMKEYGIDNFSTGQTPGETDFPSVDTLEIGIDAYFHRFHDLLPLIHEPTFSPNLTHNLIIFPICLIGLLLVDREGNRAFVAPQFAKATRKCVDALANRSLKHESMALLTALASSTLLLSCSSILDDREICEETFTLYCKALSVAQQNSIFEADKGPLLDLTKYAGRSDESAWEAWARVESMKRLIACLVMIDSHYASNMGSSPIVRADTLQFYAPCSSALFAARDANKWSQLLGKQQMESPIINSRPGQLILPVDLPSSAIAMNTLLSSIWLRVADLRHRLILYRPGLKDLVLFPWAVFQHDATGAVLLPLLRQVYTSYEQDLVRENPNFMVFWHNMYIALTANMELFERAAGREGIEAAKSAIVSIRTWAKSPCARRACLHAAQVFANMSRRKVVDGTMFLSENALFNAALVIGLYLYVEPAALRQTPRGTSTAPFELLDHVDWTELGDEGLPNGSKPKTSSKSAAMQFISEGGAVSFAGTIHRGGYGSARRVILEYVGLLEEIGKWNKVELCRILKIMSEVSDLNQS